VHLFSRFKQTSLFPFKVKAMSGEKPPTLDVRVINIANSRNHGLKCYGLDRLPFRRDPSNPINDLRFDLLAWASQPKKTWQTDFDKNDPRQRLSLFMPLGQELWLLARGHYTGESPTGPTVAVSGFVVEHTQLDEMGWAAHRLLPLLPNPGRAMHGESRINLDGALPALAETGRSTRQMGQILDVIDNQTAPAKWHGILSPMEHDIAQRADSLPPDLRPRSWCTSANLRPKTMEKFEWVFHHVSEPAAHPLPHISLAELTMRQLGMARPAPPAADKSQKAKPS
jgi:hypothetical protein